MSGHTFKVGCYNELCWRPGTDGINSYQAAIDAWNTRAERTPDTAPAPVTSEMRRNAETPEEYNRLLDLTVEAAKQPAPHSWQPISTAPKDGTKVLVGWPGVTNMGRYSSDYGGFIAVNSGVYFYPEQPTCWQPLPAPPDLERRHE